jgi:hypothetical protein
MIDEDLFIRLYDGGYKLTDIRSKMGVHYSIVRAKTQELIRAGKIEPRVWGRNSVTGKGRCACGILIRTDETICEFCIGDKKNEELPCNVLTRCSQELASAVLRHAVTEAREEQKALNIMAMGILKDTPEEPRELILDAIEQQEAIRWLHSAGAQFYYDILEFDHDYITTLLDDNDIVEAMLPLEFPIRAAL